MTRYESTTQPGTVAFPARLPGKIFQIPLGPGRSYIIQRHGFLAGLEGSELSTAFQPATSARRCSAASAFSCRSSKASATPGSSSPARSRVRPRRRTVDARSSRTRRRDRRHVEYELTTVPGIKNKVFGGDGLFLLRLTGPGKVWLQSLSLPMLAHALSPYLPQASTPQTPAQGLETIGIAAAVKGIAEIL